MLLTGSRLRLGTGLRPDNRDHPGSSVKKEEIPMKIVCLDGYTENPGDLSWADVEALGEFIYYDRTDKDNPAEIIERIGDAEIVMPNKTPITKEVIDACPNIKLIVEIATGFNNIDIAYCKEKGIPVCNVPVYGTYAVSQFAIALLLEICHRIGHHDKTVKDGKWAACPDFCYWDYPLICLEGKTMGLLGMGNIGIHTAETAKAMGMRILACDPWETERGKAVAEYVDLETVFKEADVFVIHQPLLPSNTNIVCKENIDKMKDGVIIINDSRGQMVVDQDLADALKSGKVYAAGLDVVSTEPIHSDNPLLDCPNCIITPHMAWGAKESRQRIMDTTVENIKAWMAGTPQNVVNK